MGAKPNIKGVKCQSRKKRRERETKSPEITEFLADGVSGKEKANKTSEDVRY